MTFFEGVFSYIFPPVCGICGKLETESLCEICRYNLKLLEKTKRIKIQNKYFDEFCYLFQYEGMIREKLLQYKFQDQSYLWEMFVKILLDNEKACDFLKSYDIIIPVPIDPKRRKQRGYNQTELIAKKIAKHLKMGYEKDVLIKIKNTKPQSSFNKEDRQKNIKNVYQIQKQDKIRGKRIVLFDDIYTTGSTVNECSRIVRQAQIESIGVLTIAKD